MSNLAVADPLDALSLRRNLDGPTMRNANRGDSHEWIRRNTPISITLERFVQIASNLPFASSSPPKSDSQRRGSWGVAKGSSVSWVAKFKGDKNSECKLSNGWSRSYTVIKLLLSTGK